MPTELDAIPATLLITVWARALASRPHWGIIDDPFALQMLETQPDLFEALDRKSRTFQNLMAVGVGVRTVCFDREVSEFLDKHPEGMVLNVGCGLDARSHRLDNGRATWVDVDVACSIAWRRRLLPQPSDRHHVIEGSLTEPSQWLEQLPGDKTQPVLLTVEGTLPYFDAPQIRQFITAMVEHFSARGSAFSGFVELTGDFATGKVHPSVSAIGSDAPFRSGFRRPAEALAEMHTEVRVRGHESLFQHRRSQWGIFRILTALFPSLHDRLGSVLISFATA